MFAEHVEAYTTLLDGIGATVDRDHVEQFVERDRGRSGHVRHAPAGRRRGYVADLKTGSTVEWSARSFAIQLAIYQGHVHLRLGDEHPRPAAGPRRRPRHHRPPPANDPSAAAAHWIDLAAGREALERALWVREWRKRKACWCRSR